ncbi:MAG: Gfo/Idh/MocA family oxidoreductase [Gammaproteobacteria bacterium]|nr:Gfo/Idh/MocA family oxidoreductase [Gammaproteobacteria bacterium]MBU2677070.1 Gfo/Idh/MocA family oxidoreductase [Gammaproteobacteria bacterium]NNC57066.1 Gfo/Idh/MocA family oxidoreductase [Woeseiaceae bacterium]NNL50801.1 Gfo/Idh/MocA family oxidoreductase [Woeseiaceae bacterium]
MNKIRWGILSTARIAHQFADDLAFVDNAHLAAVASRSEKTAADFAARHGIKIAYSSYQELYDDPDIDAIYIATPHTLHLENSSEALRAGKAVLCEKPLTISVEQVDTLMGVVAETGGYLMEAMWTWFLPAIQQALAWFESGEIGRLQHVKSDFGYPILPYSADRREYSIELGGGVLPDMGIYPIAIAYLFTRSDPISIDVVSRNAPNGVEDDVVAISSYPNCTASLSTSFRCKLPNRTYVIGDKGHIVIPDFWCARECHLFRVDEHVSSFADKRESHGYNFEAKAVGEDLLQGRNESTIMPLAVSRKFQEHIAAIKARC